MSFPESFVTARLRADRLTAGHVDELRRMHQDPAVMHYLGGVRNDDQTADYMARNLRHWDEHGFGLWILSLRAATARPVGRAVLRHVAIDGVDEVEVGYGFYPDCWGRGLATEITAACLAFARDPLELATIVALTSPANLASPHVLVKSGLIFDREVVHEAMPCLLFRLMRGRRPMGA
jgi:RimJ/RimL family protein N-acetyltransferase